MKPHSVMAWKQLFQRHVVRLTNIVAGLSSRGSPVWQPCPRVTAVGPDGPHDSVKLEHVNLLTLGENMDNYCRAATAQAVSTVPAWWEPAREAVPTERVDGGYLKVTHAGSNQDDMNIVWVGAAGGAIGASQVRQDMQGVTWPQNEAGRSEDGAKNPGEKVQSLARATNPCQKRETWAAAMPIWSSPLHKS